MPIIATVNTTPTNTGDTTFGVADYSQDPRRALGVIITPMGSGRVADTDDDDEYFAAVDQALANIGFRRTTHWGGIDHNGTVTAHVEAV